MDNVVVQLDKHPNIVGVCEIWFEEGIRVGDECLLERVEGYNPECRIIERIWTLSEVGPPFFKAEASKVGVDILHDMFFHLLDGRDKATLHRAGGGKVKDTTDFVNSNEKGARVLLVINSVVCGKSFIEYLDDLGRRLLWDNLSVRQAPKNADMKHESGLVIIRK